MKRIETVASMEEIMPLIVEALSRGQSVRFSPTGVSMLPMLRQGIDSVVLSPVPERLQKYDLPLYQRENGKYVLHRIVDAGHTYICMGDNQFVCESGLRHDQMIAVVSEFYRGDKKYSVKDVRYRFYCVVWDKSRSLRLLWRRGLGWIYRHLRRQGK